MKKSLLILVFYAAVFSLKAQTYISFPYISPELPMLVAGNDTAVSIGASWNMQAAISGGAGGFTYSWSPASMFDNPTSASPTITVTGPATITLTLTDAGNCEVESSFEVSINTGLNHLDAVMLKLYPNPNLGLFSIEYLPKESTTIGVEVYAIDGKLVHSQQEVNYNGKIDLDLRFLAGQMYLLKLSYGEEQQFHKIMIY